MKNHFMEIYGTYRASVSSEKVFATLANKRKLKNNNFKLSVKKGQL